MQIDVTTTSIVDFSLKWILIHTNTGNPQHLFLPSLSMIVSYQILQVNLMQPQVWWENFSNQIQIPVQVILHRTQKPYPLPLTCLLILSLLLCYLPVGLDFL